MKTFSKLGNLKEYRHLFCIGKVVESMPALKIPLIKIKVTNFMPSSIQKNILHASTRQPNKNGFTKKKNN